MEKRSSDKQDTVRFIRELDKLISKDRIEEARAYLEEGLAEAKAENDMGLELTVLNEMSGFYRINGVRDEGLKAAENALELMRKMGLSESVTAATTLINSATTMKAFGKGEESIKYYREAEAIYDRLTGENDYRRAALFNNMALALTDMGEYSEAEFRFKRALDILSNLPKGALESAMTYINMAVMYDKAGMGEKRVSECLNKAIDLFEDGSIKRDSYYAFCCRKSAPTLKYYGFFASGEELSERADKIYKKAEEDI